MWSFCKSTLPIFMTVVSPMFLSFISAYAWGLPNPGIGFFYYNFPFPFQISDALPRGSCTSSSRSPARRPFLIPRSPSSSLSSSSWKAHGQEKRSG